MKRFTPLLLLAALCTSTPALASPTEDPMQGMIINGKATPAPEGVMWKNHIEDPALAISITGPLRDGNPRSFLPTMVVLHTTKGLDKSVLITSPGPFTDHGRVAAAYCRNNPDTRFDADGKVTGGRSPYGGHHITIDGNGDAFQHADIGAAAMFHCHTCNERSVGIEIFQGAGGEIWLSQKAAVVAIVDALTRALFIPRQMPDVYRGPLARLEKHGGADAPGVFGHRDCSGERSVGDPGPIVMSWLEEAGYERFDFSTYADKIAWRARQVAAGLTAGAVDGVPGPKTLARLERDGHPHGQLVARPGD